MINDLPEFLNVDYLHNKRLLIARDDYPLRDLAGHGLHVVQYKNVEARRLHNRGVFEVLASRDNNEYHFFVFGDCVFSPPSPTGEIEP